MFCFKFNSDMSSWNVDRVTTMLDFVIDRRHYDPHSPYFSVTKSLCGRSWVESAAAHKLNVPIANSAADICAPCSSIPDPNVDTFCAGNGNNGLIANKYSFMCDKDPCVRATDAPKCCACNGNGVTLNAGPCACGIHGLPNLCAASNMYCNQASKLCANFTIPSCTHKSGLSENLESCACGSNACESASTTGLYCNQVKNSCRKYPLCPKGEGVLANTIDCACGISDYCLLSASKMFCYSPLGQCKATSNTFVSGSGSVTGPVCDTTDGTAPHNSTSSCVCGETGACTDSTGFICYAPTSSCANLPDPKWVAKCPFTDNTQPNVQVCVCGGNVCGPSVNGPYCLSAASRCGCVAGKYKNEGEIFLFFAFQHFQHFQHLNSFNILLFPTPTFSTFLKLPIVVNCVQLVNLLILLVWLHVQIVLLVLMVLNKDKYLNLLVKIVKWEEHRI